MLNDCLLRPFNETMRNVPTSMIRRATFTESIINGHQQQFPVKTLNIFIVKEKENKDLLRLLKQQV